MDPKIFSELPTDIINLIVPYLDHKITSILNKNWRLKYLEKNGITIGCTYFDRYQTKKIELCVNKYPTAKIKLIRYNQLTMEPTFNHWLQRGIPERVSAIKSALVCDVQDLLSKFPIAKISGVVTTSNKNIEAIRSEKTERCKKLRFIIDSYQSLTIYKTSLLPNLIEVSQRYLISHEELSGIESKIYNVHYKGINPKGNYPNLRYIGSDIADDIITKSDMSLPRLKTIQIICQTNRECTLKFIEKYTKLHKIRMEFSCAPYSYYFYVQLRKLPIIITTDLFNVSPIFEFEIKYREDFPETCDKVDLIINRNAIIDKSYPGMEYFNIFYR